jgi:hypothetical protein
MRSTDPLNPHCLLPPTYALSSHRDGVDFDVRSARQSRNADRGAGRKWLVQVAGVDVVDGGELAQVDEVDGGADDVFESEIGGLQNGLQVPHDLIGLCRRSAGDERTARRVEPDLARQEDERTGAETLTVGADGLRRSVGSNRLSGHLKNDLTAGRRSDQAAFWTLPDRMQRVQARMRRIVPFKLALTNCRFGFQRRRVRLFA